MVRVPHRSGFLIDTHVLIWALEDSPRLSQEHRTILRRGERIFASSVILWEIAAKSAKGKLRLTGDLDALLREAGCIELPVTWDHARRLRSLPLIHQDPFDRMLVAQAAVEQLVMLSNDKFIRLSDRGDLDVREKRHPCHGLAFLP